MNSPLAIRGIPVRPRREKPSFEILRVPSDPSLPPGDFHPYRHMREEVREASLMQSLARILNARRAWEVAEQASAAGSETSG